MHEFGHFPDGVQLFGELGDPLRDDLAAQPAGDEIQIPARVTGARAQSARQPLAKIVYPQRDRGEDRLRSALL